MTQVLHVLAKSFHLPKPYSHIRRVGDGEKSCFAGLEESFEMS